MSCIKSLPELCRLGIARVGIRTLLLVLFTYVTQHMAYVMVGGLIVSTILAMFLMPAFYLLIRRENLDGTKRKSLFRRRAKTGQEV